MRNGEGQMGKGEGERRVEICGLRSCDREVRNGEGHLRNGEGHLRDSEADVRNGETDIRADERHASSAPGAIECNVR